MELLTKCKTILENCEPIFGWKILDTMKSSSVYKLVPCGHLEYIVNKWRRLFYDKEGYKKTASLLRLAALIIYVRFFPSFSLWLIHPPTCPCSESSACADA